MQMEVECGCGTEEKILFRFQDIKGAGRFEIKPVSFENGTAPAISLDCQNCDNSLFLTLKEGERR